MQAHNRAEIVGKEYGDGQLRVIRYTRTDKHRVAWYLCKCKCGTEKEIRGKCLRSGDTLSCGCLRNRESARWKGCGGISGAYWYSLKSGAARRGIEFDLSIEEAWRQFQQQKGKCAVSGVEIRLVRNYSTAPRRKHQTASLDRIDSTKGYSKGNVAWVHKAVQQMKWNFTITELVDWCGLIWRHRNEQARCGSVSSRKDRRSPKRQQDEIGDNQRVENLCAS